MRQRGFALFDVLLAVILMAIAAAGSYTLVKSFRSNSAVQQFIRYSTMIAQGYLPFLPDGASSAAITGNALTTSFLDAVGIPSEDQMAAEEYSGSAYVNSGMFDNSGQELQMGFTIAPASETGPAQYFIIEVTGATGTEVTQVVENAASLFSVYCSEGSSAEPCKLESRTGSQSYNLWLVFPKSGNTFPT